MIKKLILAINNHRALTLYAITLAVVIELFGSTNGIWSAAALVALEVLRRRYNDLDWWYRTQKWLTLMGMSVAMGILIGGLSSLLLPPMSAAGVALVMIAALTTVATAYHLARLAVDRWNPCDLPTNILLWDVFAGIIGSMVTGTYALTCYLLGSTGAELLQDQFIWYAGGISLILIAIFVVVLLGMTISYIWEKIVDWAKR
jgi:hypothetical protein